MSLFIPLQAYPSWLKSDDPSVRVQQHGNTTDPDVTFQRESVGTVGNIVDMVICCLSFVGTLTIILPYIVNRRSRKLRHALIFGLATSDLVTSIVIIIGTACLLANINLVQAAGGCTFLGYMLVTSIFSQHLWNLSIAIVTYMILVHPLSSFTLTVEKRIRWLWPIFWLIALVVNAIAWGFGGFGFRGGYCAFTTSFYFASIFQFVPRAIVFVVIICLYTHLFFFLRRTNLFSKANHSNSIGHSRHRSIQQGHTQSKQQWQQQQQIQSHQQLQQGGHSADQPFLDTTAFNDVVLTTPDELEPKARHGSSGPSSHAEHSRKSSGSRITPILNKNDPANGGTHRRSSSLVEKDGSVEMTTLDSVARRKNSYPRAQDEDAATDSISAPLATYGLLDPNYSMASRRPMPSDLDIQKANAPHYDSSSISPHSPAESSTGTGGGGGAATLSTKGSSAPLNGSFPRGSADSNITRRGASASHKRPYTAEAGVNRASRNHSTSGNTTKDQQRRASTGNLISSDEDTDDSGDDVTASKARRMRPRKDAGDFDMITPPVEHLKHYHHSGNSGMAPLAIRNYARMTDILAMGEDEMARARAGNIASERRGSAVQIMPGEVVVEMPSKEAFEEALGNDWKWGMDVTAGTTPSPLARNGNGGGGRNGVASTTRGGGDETGLHTGTSSTSSADENGVDSIGSTLNRQASLLLLLYPAAYCVLFSFSLARLCVDLADPGASVRNAHDWLHGLSRWLIFAQGAIDALIFQFVERQFRQRMKRRRRRAMGEKVEDSFTHRVGKKAVGTLKKGWSRQSRSRSVGGGAEEK